MSDHLPSTVLTLPVIPIKEGILFPQTESVLTFGRQLSLAALKQQQADGQYVILLAQKNGKLDQPAAKDLYNIGTLAIIDKTLHNGDSVNALVRGLGRMRVDRFTQEKPFLIAQGQKIQDIIVRDAELTALQNQLQKLFKQTVQMGKQVEFLNFIKLLSGIAEGEMADQIASTLNISTLDKQKLLEIVDVKKRMRKVIWHLTREIKILEIEKDVNSKTQKKFDKHMRENILREKMEAIQKELGETSEEDEIIDDYARKIKRLKLDPETRHKVQKELKKLEQTSPMHPESGYIRNWLDLIIELPWGKYKTDRVDIKLAAKILDEDHHGLSDVKDRVLEHMAVMQLRQQGRKSADQLPTILCFVGPPGVGKTSIGQSIAKALGRTFTKISLGGVRDEAEIRGHRRTYVGAMPGRIIKAVQNAKSLNPVFMLDEIDKLGNDFRGDPSSALLEVLDPQQNHAFEDHYLDMPFDLSKVLFIATANTLDTIPAALRDRLEIIQYSGYTQEEKEAIASKYLLPKAIRNNGLRKSQLNIEAKIVPQLIKRYVREAGVRDLERTINKLLRKAARELLEHPKRKKINISPSTVRSYLGPETYEATLTEKTDQVGLATGLAWTSVGGEMLFVEVALTKGKGQVKLTGKLGEVMKESAQAAMTYVSAHHQELGIDFKQISGSNVHIHVPEGAVPKDGPSAGVTITTALVSAFTNRPVRREVAMTGEVTLRGRVLKIGGLKEKAIAAYNAGSQMVIIPQENANELEKIPDSVKQAITFHPVSEVGEVLELALGK